MVTSMVTRAQPQRRDFRLFKFELRNFEFMMNRLQLRLIHSKRLAVGRGEAPDWAKLLIPRQFPEWDKGICTEVGLSDGAWIVIYVLKSDSSPVLWASHCKQGGYTEAEAAGEGRRRRAVGKLNSRTDFELGSAVPGWKRSGGGNPFVPNTVMYGGAPRRADRRVGTASAWRTEV